jgi:arginyl-tRNA synthetase
MIPSNRFEPALRDLLQKAVLESGLPEGEQPPPVVLEIPRVRAHGDMAISVAMQLASKLRKPPLEIATSISARLESLLKESPLRDSIEKLEVKPPGFINLILTREFLYQVLKEIHQNGSSFGRSTLGQGRKAMVEFVSANPTGPLSVAHGRQAAVGDALANMLLFTGYRVIREYYLNDEGTQIDLLGESVLARARESVGLPAAFPENGYKGAYIRDIGAALVKKVGQRALEGDKAKLIAKRFAARHLGAVIHGELERFGVHFGPWFPQSSLSRFGYLNRTLGILKRRGYLYLQDGAWWLKSTAFGDDKDRVVIRSDGRLTYIAADIAYHRRKFQRGFEMLVNLWGPDHHGYIPRIKAAMQGLGYSADALQIKIVQLCTLKRGNEVIPMSTREGEFTTLTQVMDEVGIDAARFFFLLRKTDAHLEFDLELAKKHSLENPVYYIQYAHARISNILENQKKSGTAVSAPDYARLAAPEELTLLRTLREFSGSVEASARSLEPFGVISYLQGLAEAFHKFYDAHRVLSDDPALTAARLDLIRGVRTVLASGLRLLGVTAPEKM